MRFRPLALSIGAPVLALAWLPTAIAADQDSAAGLLNPNRQDQAIVLRGFDAGRPLLGASDGVPLADKDVCYTIRSYKVKPTERIKDDESMAAGYSTCEMSWAYRIRSAGATVSTRK